ncbi:MAG: extracellular solute-binding protein [Cellvibrionaceae bacterium]|nr:extracellular solute-binding protein [Cellvibrionaceae bacterium]
MSAKSRVLFVLLSLCHSLLQAQTLPADLQWETNTEDPALGSPQAQPGGRFSLSLASYPLTFRTVGPDSNSSFRSALLDNNLAPVAYHPLTDNIIPQLATHWAYGDDGRTVFYKLNPKARWSDGEPVTADDYVFARAFMRSEHIVAPWYNNYYSQELEAVTKYDDFTISITGASVKPKKDLHYYYGLSPRPKHFHVLDKDWVRAYNWRIEPNTGPYQISRFKAGKFVEFERKRDWWANDEPYFKQRYNVATVRYQVIRDINIAFKYFEKGYLDSFGLTLPSFWVNKTQGDVFKRGLVNTLTFYTDTFQPSAGIYLNQAHPLFADKNIRYGIAHALNFDKVIKTVLNNDYARLNTITEGFGVYSDTTLKARAFDLEKANDYFDRAGYTQRGADGIRLDAAGRRLSFTLSYGRDYHGDRLIVLKEEAKKVGLEMKLAYLESSAFYKHVIEKKHQAVWMAWSGGFRPQYWGQFHSVNAGKPQTNNITYTHSKVLDGYIEAYRQGTDEQLRVEFAHKIQRFIHEEGSVIPRTYVPFIREGFWRWLQLPEFINGPHAQSLFAPFGDNGGFFWIDENIKQATLAAKDNDKQGFERVDSIDTRYRRVQP